MSDAPPPQNPLHAPVTRMEFYIVLTVALGTKVLTLTSPAAAQALGMLWP